LGGYCRVTETVLEVPCPLVAVTDTDLTPLVARAVELGLGIAKGTATENSPPNARDEVLANHNAEVLVTSTLKVAVAPLVPTNLYVREDRECGVV
jgi:hypothetical protein